MLKIFHARGSRSLRVIWMAEEMGLDYELLPEAIGRSSPEFIAINPARGLPAIIDGEVSMSESVAIMQYLAARYGPTPLAPASDDPTYPAYLQYLIYGEASLSAFLNALVATRLLRAGRPAGQFHRRDLPRPVRPAGEGPGRSPERKLAPGRRGLHRRRTSRWFMR